MPTGSPDGSFITFSIEDLDNLKTIQDRSEIRHLNELIIDHARRQGGDTLAVWECLDGPLFGLNRRWRPSSVGAHLGMPQSKVNEIRNNTIDAVMPDWEKSTEGVAFKATPRGAALISQRDASA